MDDWWRWCDVWMTGGGDVWMTGGGDVTCG